MTELPEGWQAVMLLTSPSYLEVALKDEAGVTVYVLIGRRSGYGAESTWDWETTVPHRRTADLLELVIPS